MQRQLRWIGHVIRMPSNRLPRRVLYGELLCGRRHPGGQKKRFSDHIRNVLKRCHIPPEQLEVLACDRQAWINTCDAGLASFLLDYESEAENRRSRRHRPATATFSSLRCPTCNRTCASAIGLYSHLRSHRRSTTRFTPSQ